MTPKKEFTLLLLLIPAIVFSQSADTAFKPVLYGRFNFLGLADVLDGNFSLGGEYRFSSHWSAGFDAGYIFYSEYTENKGTSGFIGRPFLRLYPKQSQKAFIELEFHYKKVGYILEDWVGRDVVNGVPAYEEYAQFTWNKRATGIHFKFGTQISLSRNDKARLEFYGGAGIRWKKHGTADGTYSMETNGFDLFGRDERYVGIVFPMGFRFVYAIKE